MLCTGHAFGGRAIELSGIAVDPEIQATGVGTAMLKSYMNQQEDVEYVTSYSRNPSILKLMQTCYQQTFPLHDDEELHELTLLMPGAESINGVTYHVNRYGDDGLYGINDPADRPLKGDDMPLKEKFDELQHPGTALIIASRALSKAIRNGRP